MRIVDSITGFAVQSSSVSVDGATIQTDRLAGRTLLRVPLPKGRHTLIIAADGYQPLSIDIDDDRPLADDIVLDPASPPVEYTPEFYKPFLKPGIATFIGFLSDDQEGTPLEGAEASCPEANTATRTNTRGFFVLQVPLSVLKDAATATVQFQKAGYITVERLNVAMLSKEVAMYQTPLVPGAGIKTFDEVERSGGGSSNGAAADVHFPLGERPTPIEHLATVPQAVGTPSLPTSITVGMNCNEISQLSCTSTVTVPFEDYVTHVLPNEWPYPSWDDNAFKAGAIAVRTYGAFFVTSRYLKKKYPPIKYDICSTIVCQVYDPNKTLPKATNAADQTRNDYLVDLATRAIPQTEHSAETNDHGCGDGESGENTPSSPCIPDPVCVGSHPENIKTNGRGMCQLGSQRWATGTKTDKQPSGEEPKTWRWIVNHYYPLYSRIEEMELVDTPTITTPAKPYAQDTYVIGPNLTFTAQFRLRNTSGKSLTLSEITMGGRLNGECPGNICPDFIFKPMSKSVRDGEIVEYSGGWVPATGGIYSFFPAYRRADGTWNADIVASAAQLASLAKTINILTYCPVATANILKHAAAFDNSSAPASTNQAHATGDICVVPPSFSFSPSSQTVSATQGQSAVADMVLQSQGGLTGNATSGLWCMSSACPTGITYNFPTQLALSSNGSIPARVTFMTTGTAILGTYNYEYRATLGGITAANFGMKPYTPYRVYSNR